MICFYSNTFIQELSEALVLCLSKATTEKQMDLSTGMLLLYVGREYSSTFAPNVKAAIFQSFLLDTSKENKISPKYEKLKEEFGDYIKLVFRNIIYLY